MPRPQDEGEKRKIDLKTGWPSTSLLPTKALLSAASNVLTNPTVSSPALLYGADEGYTPVREELAKWLTEFYGDATNKYAQASSFSRDAPSVPKPDFSRIVLTGGASQSLGCILSELTDPSYTRNVWFIAPAYFMAFKMFADAGLKQRAVPQSLGIAWLRGQLQAADGEKRKQVEKSNGVDQPVSIRWSARGGKSPHSSPSADTPYRRSRGRQDFPKSIATSSTSSPLSPTPPP